MSKFEDFYKIGRRLGCGSEAAVFQGIRLSDRFPLAIKMVSKNSLQEHQLECIGNELRALSELSHPRIISLYDAFEDDKGFYICMELARGGQLFDRISKKTVYHESEARSACIAILEALKHCHDHNFVHRDLKPENLVLTSFLDDTAVKLIDFGFAVKSYGNDTLGIMGTTIYMAPEIWRNEAYGKPVDMWAMGVVLYILLGGYPPFSDDTKNHVILQILTGKVYFHEEYWTGITSEAKDLISRLLVHDVDRRLTADQALRHPWVS